MADVQFPLHCEGCPHVIISMVGPMITVKKADGTVVALKPDEYLDECKVKKVVECSTKSLRGERDL